MNTRPCKAFVDGEWQAATFHTFSSEDVLVQDDPIDPVRWVRRSRAIVEMRDGTVISLRLAQLNLKPEADNDNAHD